MIRVVFQLHFPGESVAGCEEERTPVDDRKVTLRLTFSLTESVHLDIKTFLKAACLALISSLFIYDTISIPLAGIDHISPYATHEETTTSITRVDSIMTTRRNISANFTKNFGLAFHCFQFLRRGVFTIHFVVF